jgi:hypothetical protein
LRRAISHPVLFGATAEYNRSGQPASPLPVGVPRESLRGPSCDGESSESKGVTSALRSRRRMGSFPVRERGGFRALGSCRASPGRSVAGSFGGCRLHRSRALRDESCGGTWHPPTSSLGGAGVFTELRRTSGLGGCSACLSADPLTEVRSAVDVALRVDSGLAEANPGRGPKVASWRLEPEGPWAVTRHAAGERRCLPWGSFPFGGISSGDPKCRFASPTRSALSVSHALSGFLPPGPCGFVSRHIHP